MDLTNLTNVNVAANVATLAVLVAGFIFGALQVKAMAKRRRDAISLEAVRIMQDEATTRAVQCVLGLPDGVTEEQLAMRGPEVEACVTLVEYNFDTLGWMVHRGLIPLHDLDDLMGGAVRAVWDRVRILADERRRQKGRPSDFEWTQWLAERLESDPSPAKRIGAYAYYKR